MALYDGRGNVAIRYPLQEATYVAAIHRISWLSLSIYASRNGIHMEVVLISGGF